MLIVDDEAALARAIGINLRAQGFEVAIAVTGSEALSVAKKFNPDVVVLDLGLPDMDGSAVLAGVRSWSTAPVIVLSARFAGVEKVRLLEGGADDYVTKPFEMDELVARVRAAMRRADLSRVQDLEAVVTDSFAVDLAAGTVTREGTQVRLTPTEWHLLEVLATHPNRLVSQAQLLKDVWGPGYESETHYLRVYIAQLRRKLEKDPAHPRHLITEPGLGYRLTT